VIANKLGSRNISAVLKNTFDNLSNVEKDLATKYKVSYILCCNINKKKGALLFSIFVIMIFSITT
jgi:hypothetical protein